MAIVSKSYFTELNKLDVATLYFVSSNPTIGSYFGALCSDSDRYVTILRNNPKTPFCFESWVDVTDENNLEVRVYFGRKTHENGDVSYFLCKCSLDEAVPSKLLRKFCPAIKNSPGSDTRIPHPEV